MAGLGEILALAATGAMIDGRQEKLDTKNKNNKSKKEIILNTRDIYAANNSRVVRDTYDKYANHRYKASIDFKNTKIIPKNYEQIDDYNQRKNNKIQLVENFDDSDSEFSADIETFDDNQSTGSDQGYHGFNALDSGSMLDKMANLSNNRKFESCVAKESKMKRNKFNEKNGWTQQYEQMAFNNPDGPVAVNSSNKKSIGKNSSMARIELERQMEIDGGYSAFEQNDDGTYGVVRADSSDFIHENMQPFVRKGPNQNEENKRAMVNRRTLELFTGSVDNPDWRPKIERAPLFSPLIGAKNLYGDPVRTDEYKSRYFPGNERRNELPFQQVKVTPGLDIGYNAVGKQGYHDMYRVIPREAYVDQLKTLNNPKISYGSYVGPGKKGEKGPIMGSVVQYKTPKFSERGVRDMVRGRSYITAPTIYGEYDPKNLATVNRGTKKTMMMGPAQHYLPGNTPGKYLGNYREANKENYKYDDPRNVIMYEALAGQGHNNESFIPDATQREMKSQHGHAFNQEHTKEYAVNHESFIPNVTNRQIHDKSDRTGHVGNAVINKGIAVNWNDLPNVTKRQIHDQFDRTGHLTGEKNQQFIINWNDVPDPTKRQLHDQYDRTGNVIGDKNQYRTVNWNNVPDPTKRQLHDQYDRTGNFTGEKNQHHTVNWNDVPDPTKRQLHDQYDRQGNVTGEKNQYRTINWNNVPDPTKRQIHDQYDRQGNVTGEKNQYRTINWNNVPDPTKRQLHDQYDRQGNVTGEKNQYRTVNWNNAPDPTKRQLHDQYDRQGNVTGEKNQYRTVNWNDVPDPTKRQLHDQYDRQGNVTGEKNQYRTVNWNDVPDPTKRQLHDQYDRQGNVIGEKNQYRTINWNNAPDPTKRQLHDQYDRQGNVTGEKNQYRTINWNNVPDPTKRQIHDQYDRQGNVTGEKNQYRTINWNNIPDPTKRQLHDQYDRQGNVTGEKNQYRTINWNNVPDPTKRQFHDQYDRQGNVTGEKNQYRTVNWNDVPDITRREMNPGGRSMNVTGNKQGHTTINWNDVPDITRREINPGGRSMNVTGNKQGHTTINWNDVPDITRREMNPGGRSVNVTGNAQGHATINWNDVPDITRREMNPGGRSMNVTGNTQGHVTINWNDVPDVTKREIHPGGRAGGADSRNPRQGSRHQYMNMKVNGAKEALEQGRAPTKIGIDKGWTVDHTAFNFKCPVESTWTPGPGSDIMFVSDQLGSTNTNVPTNRFWVNNRILAHTEDNLKGNSLVNNLIHKAI
jgi:hypothetical protein